MDMVTAITVDGASKGTIMWVKRRRKSAPSISAASINFTGIFFKPAKYKIMMYGICRHTPTATRAPVI